MVAVTAALRLTGWVTGLWRDMTVAPVGAEERSAFDAFNLAALRREALRFVPILAGFNLVFWSLDPIAFAATPHALWPIAVGRALHTLVATLVLGVLFVAPRQAYRAVTIGSAVTCFDAAASLGAAGPPSGPWFHFLYPFVLLSIGWFYWPSARVGVSLLNATAVLLGYFALHPRNLGDPFALPTLGYFAFVVFVGLCLGLYEDRRKLALFLTQRELERERALLATRVAEQTDDLRRLARGLDAVTEAERAHVARELHDELGQSLTAIHLVLRVANQRFGRDPAAIGANLAQLTELVGNLSTQTRKLVHDLRPPVLEQLGLSASLEWLVARFSSLGGPTCTVTVPETEVKLAPQAANAAFRCVQEALTNVARHSGARRVDVRVAQRDTMLEVEVRDDGVGLSNAQTDGVGLIGMRERAAAAGGRFDIGAPPGGGTRVRIQLPVEGR